jgi:hypothetical protein
MIGLPLVTNQELNKPPADSTMCGSRPGVGWWQGILNENTLTTLQLTTKSLLKCHTLSEIGGLLSS